MELAVLLPALLIVILGTVDFGRLIHAHQILSDLTREAGSLVSRGSSGAQAFAATLTADAPLDLSTHGGVIVSRVRKRDQNDSQPWVFEQEVHGALGEPTSKIGRRGGPATIPGIDRLDEGVTIVCIEMFHRFEPLFAIADFGLDMYPEVLYDAAFF